MDRAALTEIFDYDEWCWHQIVEQCSPLGDQLLTKVAPGSGWPTLGNCLGHMIMANKVWLDTLGGAPRVAEDVSPLIPTWSELDSFAGEQRRRFRDYLGSLSDEALFADITISVYEENLAYTPAELLGNLVVHERGHHGDVNTLLYQLGTDDLGVPDYRWFVNFKRGYR